MGLQSEDDRIWKRKRTSHFFDMMSHFKKKAIIIDEGAEMTRYNPKANDLAAMQMLKFRGTTTVFELKINSAMELPNNLKPFLRKIESICPNQSIQIIQYSDRNSSGLKMYDLAVYIPLMATRVELIELIALMKDAERVCEGLPKLSLSEERSAYILICPNIDEHTARKLISYKVLLDL